MQIKPDDLCFRQQPFDYNTAMTCIVGGEDTHSLTPRIYSEVFAKLDLNIVYLNLRILQERLEDTVRGLKAIGVRAYFVTMPHKRSVMQFLDEIDPVAEAIGAVNLVVNDCGRLVGRNSDVAGFMHPLGDIDLAGKKVLFLGSGGGGSACAYGLTKANCELTILSRNEDHAAALANNLRKHFGKDFRSYALNEDNLRREISDAFLLVNTTSLGYGMNADKTPVPASLLRKDLVVFDIVNAYNTPLIRDSKAAGCLTFNGNDMLAFQTKILIEALTGEEQPASVVEICKNAGIRTHLSCAT